MGRAHPAKHHMTGRNTLGAENGNEYGSLIAAVTAIVKYVLHRMQAGVHTGIGDIVGSPFAGLAGK